LKSVNKKIEELNESDAYFKNYILHNVYGGSDRNLVIWRSLLVSALEDYVKYLTTPSFDYTVLNDVNGKFMDLLKNINVPLDLTTTSLEDYIKKIVPNANNHNDLSSVLLEFKGVLATILQEQRSQTPFDQITHDKKILVLPAIITFLKTA
jgi:hypothetical protein